MTLDPGHEPGSAYLDVRDADALFEEWTTPGVGGLTRPVELMPYGLREGSHVDPDGNLIRFGSPDEEVEWRRARLPPQHLVEAVGQGIARNRGTPTRRGAC